MKKQKTLNVHVISLDMLQLIELIEEEKGSFRVAFNLTI